VLDALIGHQLANLLGLSSAAARSDSAAKSRILRADPNSCA